MKKTKFIKNFINFSILLMAISCGEGAGPLFTSTEIGYGTISGNVSDASNGNPISGATIYVSGYQSATQTTTNSSGNYSIALAPEGAQSLVATKSGYVSGSANVTVTKNQTTSNNNMYLLSTAYANGNFTIILSWGDNTKPPDPIDLDSHLIVPTVGTHVYYQVKGSLTAAPYASLDLDDTNAGVGDLNHNLGQETISIAKTGTNAHYNGTYKYYVHNYSKEAGPTIKDFVDATAKVFVYNNGVLVKSYTAPAGTGKFWYVFDLNNSTLTDHNTIVTSAPTR